MLNQGMWAWIVLVSAEKAPLRMESLSEPGPEFSPAPRIESLVSCPTLLGVFTDLLLGQLTAQEAI